MGFLNADCGQMLSKETLQLFQDYSSSPHVNLRTISNCLLFVVVPYVLLMPVVTLELDDISAGLSGRNWNQILIVVIGSISICCLIFTRYIVMVSESCVTTYHHFLAYLAFVISTTGFLIFVEKVFVYPVPFCMFATGQVGCPVLFGTMLWFERNNPVPVKASLFKFGMSLAISLSLFTSHQLIAILYTAQSDPIVQSIVALLLPTMKFVYRYVVMEYLGQEFQSLATILAVFEIEFFNTLYTSVFMQTSTDSMVLLTLVSVDIVENCSFLVRMNIGARKFKRQVAFENGNDENLRRILWQTQMVVLVELVEVITPVLYLAFLYVLRRLHNIRYVEGLAAMSDDQFNASLWNLALLAVFELFSLTTFIGSLKYRFDIPGFTQMGFFIQQRKYIILPLMCTWFSTAVGINMVHMGMDFTFTFDPEYFHFVI